ncbi:MAG: imidazoleglycerol-phosphate dehydratase HisB [Planctomycetota bacterium]
MAEERKRTGEEERTTAETSVEAQVCIDGEGEADVDTGLGFLDHMLELLAKHAKFDLYCRAEGDLHVDGHHTTEDVGIVLGTALRRALGDKKGIRRFGDADIPMAEALASVAVDIDGRNYLSYSVEFENSSTGDFDVELIHEFFQAFCRCADLTLHIDVVRGSNSHHISEAIFKGLARTLREATSIDPRSPDEVPSTKGTL